MGTWEREHPVYKGQVIAWWLYKGIREGYETERQREKAKNKNGKDKFTANPAFRHGRSLLEARAARARA